MRSAAAAFWEGCFQTPFPSASTPEPLPEKEDSVWFDNSAFAMSSPTSVSKLMCARFPLKKKKAAKISNAGLMPAPRAGSWDEADRVSTTRSLLPAPVLDIRKSVSADCYDGARNRRAQRAVSARRKLPSIADDLSTGKSAEAVARLRAISAVVRADLIHGRREGTVEGFDDMMGRYWDSTQPCPQSNGSSHSCTTTRSSSQSSLQTSGKTQTFTSTPSSSGSSSFDGRSESWKDLIAKNPVLQEVVSVKEQHPSFARSTISSLIQRFQAQALEPVVALKPRKLKKM